jgi:RNA polymerase sigma-70 factor (ECF subfamily)
MNNLNHAAAYAEFPSTHWSIVGDAGHAAAEEAKRQAIQAIIVRYSPALLWYLVRNRRLKPNDADDVLQSFITERVLIGELMSVADKERGRFRSFLITTLNRFHSNYRRSENARKRAPEHRVSLDGPIEAACADSRHADTFDVAWAREVLAEAVQTMRKHCVAIGRADLWRIFEARILLPTLEDAPPVSYSDLVAELHFSSPTQASNALVTAQRNFIRILRSIVGRYESDSVAIDDEINDLKRILSSAGAESAAEPGIP